MALINFFCEEISFALPNPRKTSNWIKSTIKKENKELTLLNIIFCSDNYLKAINIEYLEHDTFTDIITFDQSEFVGQIEGDIFISIDRISENSTKYQQLFIDELHRVIIHGVLHLAGYTDKTKEAKEIMRVKENEYLNLR